MMNSRSVVRDVKAMSLGLDLINAGDVLTCSEMTSIL